jgi:hypothetical protein
MFKATKHIFFWGGRQITKVPLQRGEIVCAIQTGACTLETMPTLKLMKPKKMLRDERIMTNKILAYIISILDFAL